MTLPNGREPVPQLTTTKIGGGRSAWLIAIGVVAVLGSLIYIGVSGRNPGAAADAAPSLAAAEVSTPLPTPSSPSDDEIQVVRANPAAPVLYQYLGAALDVNGRGTLAVMDPVGPSEYRVAYRIPYPLVGPTADLTLDAVTASVSNYDLDRLGAWTFPINTLDPGGPGATVLDMFEPGEGQTLSNSNYQVVADNGYHVTVATQNLPDAGLLSIDVVVNADLFVPDESYSIGAGLSGSRFAVNLEKASDVSFIGQQQIPQSSLGRFIPVSLTAVPVSDPSVGTVTVGTWWIQVPKRPSGSAALAQVDGHSVARPIAAGEPQIIANGYDIGVSVAVVDKNLVLRVVLTITPTR